MADRELDELIRSLDGLPVAAAITDLKTRHILAVNAPGAAFMDMSADDLVGTDVVRCLRPDYQEAARKGFQALADRVIDGYQARRVLVSMSGVESPVLASGRRVEWSDREVVVWIFLPDGAGGGALDTLLAGTPNIVLALTDHDWQIEYISADVATLLDPDEARSGFPLLGLVRPSAAGEFLAAAARAVADRAAVTVLTTMHAAPKKWEARSCLIVPMSGDDPPRLGVVISAPSSADISSSQPPGVHRHLSQAALDMRTSRTLRALPALSRLPGGQSLSSRQIEIVSRLASGQRIADIAKSMYLSPST
ncbi:MAG: hypothetical protein JO148_12345, partial [Acidimicrobiia bacterium]|nr:hypothetical protein [Acidimicrobiia bacterium]